MHEISCNCSVILLFILQFILFFKGEVVMKNNSAFLQSAQHRNIRSKGRSRLRFYAAVVLSAFLLAQNTSVLTLHALAEEIPAAETLDPAIPRAEAAIMEAPDPEALNPAIPDPADPSLPASLLPGKTVRDVSNSGWGKRNQRQRF